MNNSSGNKNLASRSLGSLFWLFSGTGLKLVIQLVQTVVLSRLLTPTEFGLMGAALIVVRFVEKYPIGIGPPLIQLPKLETRHLRTGFTISVIFGLLSGLILWLAAPLCALFLRNEATIPLIRFLSLTFPLRGLAIVAEALLERELKFRWLSSLQVISYAIGYGLVGVTLALLNFGVWSLVFAYTVQIVIRSIPPLIVQPHPKKFQLDKTTVQELTSLGGGFILTNFLQYWALKGDYLVISRGLGIEALGLYTKAYNLMNLPAANLGYALNRVLFASLAKLQDEPERLVRAYRRNLVIVSLMVFPLSLVMFVLSREIILVLLGNQWTEVIVPFQILALGTFFRFGDQTTGAFIRSSGQMYQMAALKFIYIIFVVGGSLVGLNYGIPGVTWGVTIALVVQYLLLTGLTVKLTQIDWQTVISSHLRSVPLCLLTGLLVWGNATLWRSLQLSDYLVLSLSLLLTGIMALICIYILPQIFLGEDGQWLWQNLAKLGQKVKKPL